MMLTLRPDLVVGDVTRLATVPFGRGAAPGYRGWTMPDRSEPGHIGDPAAATREKGEGLFREFAGGVESFLTRVVEATDARWDL
jgi:creatinine amidohydrolase